MSFNSNKSTNPSGNHNRRPLFGPQPARILLLDSIVLQEEWLGKSVIEALEKIFLLSANLSGTCPVPLIGIYLLTVYPEMILPLSHTKSNFVRLHSALTDLHSLILDHGKLDQSRLAQCCLVEGVAEACRQFRRYTGNLTANSGTFHQLEVIFITTRQENDVKKQFNSLPDQADLNIIKRIVCASISSVFNDTPLDSQDVSMEMMSNDFSSLVDTVILEADPLSLQKFLYSWLSDNTSDTEQLQLVLPPPSPVDPQLVIKCDMTERIINPLQLPVHDALSLDMKSNVCKHVFPPPSKAVGLQVPIFQLKVLHTIPRHSVCDSLLFGQPIALHPTGCWKMDWDCLESNQQLFQALCAEMVKKDHVLLTRLLHPGQNPDTEGSGHNRLSGLSLSVNNSMDFTKPPPASNSHCSSKPAGLFILMPSEKSFLLKSVASGELYLSSSRSVSSGSVSEESHLCIQASLSKVEELSHFNPLDFQCGLFQALKTVSLPKSYINKARQQQQHRVSGGHKKAEQRSLGMTPGGRMTVEQRPLGMTPGGRVTASGWSGNITDVSGTKTKQAANAGKSKRAF